MTTHKQPEGQDRNVFNSFKRTLKNLSQYTDEQLAVLGYEVWHQAYIRYNDEEHKSKQ